VTLSFRLLFVLLSAFKSRKRLAAENIVLRQQLIILRRRHRGRIWLSGADRALLGSLVRLVPAVLDAVIIVKPETVLRWHRKGFRGYWRLRSTKVGGRPPIGTDLRAVVCRMAVDNPLWGAPRTAQARLFREPVDGEQHMARPVCKCGFATGRN
jgi:hypothetical protein